MKTRGMRMLALVGAVLLVGVAASPPSVLVRTRSAVTRAAIHWVGAGLEGVVGITAEATAAALAFEGPAEARLVAGVASGARTTPLGRYLLGPASPGRCPRRGGAARVHCA
jgi:hypothetical protein